MLTNRRLLLLGALALSIVVGMGPGIANAASARDLDRNATRDRGYRPSSAVCREAPLRRLRHPLRLGRKPAITMDDLIERRELVAREGVV